MCPLPHRECSAVGYLTESLHGAGSPQAQRIQIQRQMQIEFQKQLAKRLAGIDASTEVADGLGEFAEGYFARVFSLRPHSAVGIFFYLARRLDSSGK